MHYALEVDEILIQQPTIRNIRYTGIVEHDVEVTEFRQREIHQRLDGFPFRHIGLLEARRGSQSGTQRTTAFLIDVGDDNLCALLHEQFNGATTKPVGSARDNCHFPCKLIRHAGTFFGLVDASLYRRVHLSRFTPEKYLVECLWALWIGSRGDMLGLEIPAHSQALRAGGARFLS